MSADLLAFGAHPDDVELGVGGLIHQLAQTGKTVVIADMTRGEMASRGTVEERHAAAKAAGKIMGVTERVNLGLPDGRLEDNDAQREAVLGVIRRFKPKTILAPMTPDRHPDHEAAHHLVRHANFFAGLSKMLPGDTAHRAERIYYYYPYHESDRMPTFIVDVSAHFEEKLNALRAHRSQFFNPEYSGTDTLVASEAFWKNIEHRAAALGSRIGVAFGEALFSLDPVGVEGVPGL